MPTHALIRHELTSTALREIPEFLSGTVTQAGQRTPDRYILHLKHQWTTEPVPATRFDAVAFEPAGAVPYIWFERLEAWFELPPGPAPLVQGPPPGDSVGTFLFPGHYAPASLAEHFTALRHVVAAIRGLSPLSVSPSLREMARETVRRLESRANEDIETWAQLLAEDVRNAED